MLGNLLSTFVKPVAYNFNSQLRPWLYQHQRMRSLIQVMYSMCNKLKDKK